jgi:hypothetical protein
MTEFPTLGLSNHDLKLVNNWRIYFQVNTLAEICIPEGTCIQTCFFKMPSSSHTPRVNSSKLQWPQQGMPSKRGFSIWLKCLQSLFNMTTNGRINHKFGKWLSTETLIQNNDWLFYIQPSSGLLFTKKNDDNNYLYTIATTTRKNYVIYNSEGKRHLIDHIPNDCILTNLRLIRKKKLLVATFNNPDLSETIIIKGQPDWKNSFIGNTTILDNNKLKNFISQDEFTIFIASDGGVHNYEGTFGIAISDGTSLLATNNGKFYSVDFCESSYRSELYAMLSGVLTFKSLCIHSNALQRAKI